jgi:glycosyltransferase involved in cell wall biosynthesis
VELPEVSVVIPAHNEELLIERCLRSVLSNDTIPIEVIVVLDRCSDQTAAVVQSIGDTRLRCINNVGPMGIGGTLNTGIGAARSDLVARLDADDVQEPDRFAVQVQHLKQQQLDICCGWARAVVPGGSVRLQTTPLESDQIKTALKRANVIIHSTVLMRAESVRAVGGYRTTRWEDYDLWIRLIQAGAKFGCVGRVVVTRALRNDGWSASRGDFIGHMEVMRHRFRAALAVGSVKPW